MDKVILLTIAIFFCISGFDYIRGNKWGMGTNFKEGIMSTGMLIISMVGIFAFSPLIGEIIGKLLIPIGKLLNIDPSVFTSMFLAVDMGGLGIAKTLALNMEMYMVSGVVISSTLGATVSFSIPLALGLIKNEYQEDFVKGLVYGIITMPIAPILASLMLGLDIKTIAINMAPIIMMVLILCIGMIKFRKRTIEILNKLGRGIHIASVIGLLLLGFTSIVGIKVEGLVIPFGDTLAVACKIAVFIGGAYPMIEFITDKFSNELRMIGNLIDVNRYAVSSLFGSLVSNIIAFKNFDKMNSKGRILCMAFSVSGAFVLGGQMGFVSAEAPDILNIYMISKLLAGIFSLLLVCIVYREKKCNKY